MTPEESSNPATAEIRQPRGCSCEVADGAVFFSLGVISAGYAVSDDFDTCSYGS